MLNKTLICVLLASISATASASSPNVAWRTPSPLSPNSALAELRRNTTRYQDIEWDASSIPVGSAAEGVAGGVTSAAAACYPALTKATSPGIPSGTANPSVLSSWWCAPSTEYAYFGFSYDVSACQSQAAMISDFAWMKSTKQARYVRIYGACDDDNFNNHMVEAAAQTGLGVYALIWFGFDGDDLWKTRMAKIIKTIKTNQKAPYVIRNVALGSEPLYDWVLTPDQLATQLDSLRTQLAGIGVPVTLSEMAWGFQMNDNTPQVFRAMQSLSLHSLPFFDGDATTASAAWPSVLASIQYMQQNGPGKKLTLTQTGWPSNSDVWKPNSPNAVASVQQEKAYFDLLNSKCAYFKSQNIGWFSHIFDDDTLPGWGVVNGDGTAKFTFQPRVAC